MGYWSGYRLPRMSLARGEVMCSVIVAAASMSQAKALPSAWLSYHTPVRCPAVCRSQRRRVQFVEVDHREVTPELRCRRQLAAVTSSRIYSSGNIHPTWKLPRGKVALEKDS